MIDDLIVEGDYERDGAVCVRQAFTPEHVTWAREAIEAVLADLSPLAKRASAHDDGAFVEDFCNWHRSAVLERFVRESPAAEIAAHLTGSDTIRLYHDHVLVKEPGTRQRTPWHRDSFHSHYRRDQCPRPGSYHRRPADCVHHGRHRRRSNRSRP
jgi:ectoine hydroxylase-related dioxygenase (phytanoyl-CoA dioxygenase family)